jgi:hypothetical protein
VNATINDVLQQLATIYKRVRKFTYQVISTVNFGVEINDGGTVVEPAVKTKAGGSSIVVAR